MTKKVLSDVELRARWVCGTVYEVEEGTILTPAAKDFVREHHIEIFYRPPRPVGQSMTRTPIPVKNGKAVYVDYQTGQELTEKPEEMTHLCGNQLVSKHHPRIAFRGELDSLMAEFLLAQTETDVPQLAQDLTELLDYTRRILAAEVKEETLPELRLLGMDSDGIRRASHSVKESVGIDHPVPDWRMGRMSMLLNRLRTKVRECELSAVTAFLQEDGSCGRKDIVEALNRLSSCVYLLFCRQVAGYYERGRTK